MSKNFASNRDDYVTSRRKTQAGGLCHYGKDTGRRPMLLWERLCYFKKKDTGRRPMPLRERHRPEAYATTGKIMLLQEERHRPEAYATTGKTQAGGLCYYGEIIK